MYDHHYAVLLSTNSSVDYMNSTSSILRDSTPRSTAFIPHTSSEPLPWASSSQAKSSNRCTISSIGIPQTMPQPMPSSLWSMYPDDPRIRQLAVRRSSSLDCRLNPFRLADTFHPKRMYRSTPQIYLTHRSIRIVVG